MIVGLITALMGTGLALGEQAEAVKVTELTPQIRLLTTDQTAYVTHSLVYLGPNGLLLVDTQTRDDAPALKEVVDGFGLGIPRYIINTHRHVEHIGGNELFGTDPVVIAHELLPTKLTTGSYVFDEYPAATFPDITVADSLTVFFGDERIRIIALAGSHDDNEIIVHFTKNKVVHLSSLVNGFSFPSLDGDGDALRFAELVTRAIELLPPDVTIVSGHGEVGSWQDLHGYREMLVGSTAAVRDGLAAGKDVQAMQEEEILAEWASYARNYVSASEWIETLAEAMEETDPLGEDIFVPLYNQWRDQGPQATVDFYNDILTRRAQDYDLQDYDLLVVGGKMLQREDYAAAVVFLEASLTVYPEARYGYYTYYQLAKAHQGLGEMQDAIQQCRKALEIQPEFGMATELLADLED